MLWWFWCHIGLLCPNGIIIRLLVVFTLGHVCVVGSGIGSATVSGMTTGSVMMTGSGCNSSTVTSTLCAWLASFV